jgi:penicillin-binding protein 2
VRRNYTHLINDPNHPMTHKALERNYPPGSCAKPLVLLIGLEEGKVRADEVIHCPYQPPSRGWPRCLLQRNYGSCHDWRWEHEGGNNARNAMRGSCNIYFSQLAHRIDGTTLQSRLFELGFGRAILSIDFPQVFIEGNPQFAEVSPRIRQAHGNLIYDPVNLVQPAPAAAASDLPAIPEWERKWWGIGQGNLRVTVLQTANALAAIARNGVYKQPRLIVDETDYFNERGQRRLSVSRHTFDVVRDGMSAVVNMEGGSAYSKFRNSDIVHTGDENLRQDRLDRKSRTRLV